MLLQMVAFIPGRSNIVLKHEASSAHRNAVIAQAVFSKEQSIQHCLNEQSKAELEWKKTRLLKIE